MLKRQVLWVQRRSVLCASRQRRAYSISCECDSGADGGPSGGAALVTVVQSTNFRECDYVACRHVLDASWSWCVLGQGQMGSRPMIVDAVTRQDSTQVLLAKHDHVVQTFAPD